MYILSSGVLEITPLSFFFDTPLVGSHSSVYTPFNKSAQLETENWLGELTIIINRFRIGFRVGLLLFGSDFIHVGLDQGLAVETTTIRQTRVVSRRF